MNLDVKFYTAHDGQEMSIIHNMMGERWQCVLLIVYNIMGKRGQMIFF